MNCKRYQDWIRDAALDALKPSRRAELAAHLSGCPECARALEAERGLLAAVDRGLARHAAARPSDDFVARVRSRLAEERVAERSRAGRASGRRLWAPAMALAALAALLLTIWLVRRAPRRHAAPLEARSSAPGAPVRSTAPSAGSQATVSRAPARVVPRPQPLAPLARGPERRREAPGVQAPKVAVLVQPGQWAGIVSLYRAAQSGRIDTASLAGRPADSEDPLKLAPVEVEPLAISELNPPEPIDSAGANHSHP